MQRKKLTKEEKEMFSREIEQMRISILEKKHLIAKFIFQQMSIQESLDSAIETEKNKIRSAKALIADYNFDFQNQVTYNAIGQKIKEAEQEINRLENNTKVRKEQIEKGIIVKSRDEKAREKIKNEN